MRRRDAGVVFMLDPRHWFDRVTVKKGKREVDRGRIYFGRTLPQYLTEVGLDLNTIHGNDGPVAAYRNVCHVPATVRGVE